MNPETKLKELGITLPEPPETLFSLLLCRQAGNLVYVSGHGPMRPDGTYVSGRLGEDISIEDAQAAGRLTMIALLASLKSHIGDLNRVKQVVKLLCMVNSTPDFHQQPLVANGASDLLIEVFGEAGRHARSAFGATSFYLNIPIEVEMIVELKT